MVVCGDVLGDLILTMIVVVRREKKRHSKGPQRRGAEFRCMCLYFNMYRDDPVDCMMSCQMARSQAWDVNTDPGVAMWVVASTHRLLVSLKNSTSV